MYPEPRVPHHHPHFHVRCAGASAVYRISPPSLLAGAIPSSQAELVVAWASVHQRELMENWARLQKGERALPIAPLP